MLRSWQNLYSLQEYQRHREQQQRKQQILENNKDNNCDNNDDNDNDATTITIIAERTHQRNQNRASSTTNTTTTTTSTTTTSTTMASSIPSIIDRQLKNEFACNAFNAVQEVLNVYGLSISPGDIVDAFKMQQQQLRKVGECQQPPTPPRTPISTTTSSTTSTIPALLSTSINNDRKDDNDSLHQHYRQLLERKQHHQQSTHDTDTLDNNKTIVSIAKCNVASRSLSTNQQQSSPVGKLQQTVGVATSSTINDAAESSDYCGDDSTSVGNEPDNDIDETNKRYGNTLQGHLRNSLFSDRFDDASSSYDLNHHAYNDNDSNISSMIDDDQGSSDDITLGGDSSTIIVGENRQSADGSTGGDDDGEMGDSENRRGGNQNSDENVVGRLSVKNVDSLLEKCSLLAQLQNDDKQLNADGIKYLTKFSSYHQCKTNSCQIENLREHYHCFDIPCLGKVFNKKEEVIRHLKWHKKRAESLNHGFLRFSSSDDCSLAFGQNCTHNRKQTHYHCFQPNCDKVYISTSDVQMHSNYHRKDSAIYQEGFQRYRATEECNADYCMFAGQRTTHFHCRRDNCRYTFKNKADMEKHKSYHIKDLQLARDGFKKFLKTESCPYERCRFSRICNHIHCVRENCHYVLHSSGQLLSHKRKHERMDSEQAYRRFKIAQKAAAAAAAGLITSNLSPTGSIGTTSILGIVASGSESKPSTPSTSSSVAISPDLHLPSDLTTSFSTGRSFKSDTNVSLPLIQSSPLDVNLLYSGSTGLPIDIVHKLHQRHQLLTAGVLGNVTADDVNLLAIPSARTPSSLSSSSAAQHPPLILPAPVASLATRNAFDEIEELIQQYFTSNCSRQHSNTTDQIEPLNLKSSASVNDQQSLIIPITGKTNSLIIGEKLECLASISEPHLHCLIKNCDAVVARNLIDISEHMQMHELNRNADSIIQNSNLLQITSIEGFFNRKRGRPPKNRVVEVYNSTRNQSPQAIFTSFKLEKTLNDPQVFAPQLSISSNQSRTSTSTITSQVANLNAAFAETPNLSAYLTNGQVQVFHSGTQNVCDNDINNSCTLAQQFHFHCRITLTCSFYTSNPHTMDQHIAERHLQQTDEKDETTLKTITSQSWQHYSTSTNCSASLCIYREKVAHYHCNKCDYTTTLIGEIDEHAALSTCNSNTQKYDTSSLSPTNAAAAAAAAAAAVAQCYSNEIQTILLNNNNQHQDGNRSLSVIQDANQKAKKFLPSYDENIQCREDVIAAATAAFYNAKDKSTELCTNSATNSPNKMESIPNEDEKVSVVRAAGTYFPQNSNSSNEAENSGQPPPYSDQESQPDLSNIVSTSCQRPFCKLKRKPHRHCNLCNQAFSDGVKLEIHRLKHSTLSLSASLDIMTTNTTTTPNEKDPSTSAHIKDEIVSDDHSTPQDLSKSQTVSLSSPSESSSTLLNFSNATAAMAAAISPVTSGLQQMLPQNFAENFSMQNLHLAQLALYQQNPFYYQSFYPFLRSQNVSNALSGHPELLQVQLAMAAAASNGAVSSSADTIDPKPSPSPVKSEGSSSITVFPFAAAAAAAAAVSAPVSSLCGQSPFEVAKLPHEFFQTIGQRKRKADDYDAATSHGLLDMGLVASAASALVGGGGSGGGPKKIFKATKPGNFKIFKDEPIPHGYLKFRFNEDCNFSNCGYRNHQSHFHCCRKDCYYSFCDKTRFVQHTARHERLDKLMGDDFKQYRANMRCGFDDCVYNKNLAGQNNKSSHFHCLKCNFICSDTNKVVAHRRQHSKMEFIRMAGFRKVANNEKCNAQKNYSSSITPPVGGSEQHSYTNEITTGNNNNGGARSNSSSAGSTGNSSGTECTYSLKQTHYHCLVCDCSVLSRAQLGSHRHRIQ